MTMTPVSITDTEIGDTVTRLENFSVGIAQNKDDNDVWGIFDNGVHVPYIEHSTYGDAVKALNRTKVGMIKQLFGLSGLEAEHEIEVVRNLA